MILDIPMPSPDNAFYYVLSALLGSALIWIIARYLGKNEDTQKVNAESIQKLTTIVTLHDHRITEAENDIKDLQSTEPQNRKRK